MLIHIILAIIKANEKKKTHTVGTLHQYDEYTFACVSK